MTRGNARELAVHLIYGRAFTGEEPEQVISTRLEKEYYAQLGKENEVYSERPSRAQLRYIDSVVTGVANREEELDEQIQKYAIGWDISRISKLAHGKRIFKMAPLHHHFEMCGWNEKKIVAVFTVVSALMCLLAYWGVADRFSL